MGRRKSQGKASKLLGDLPFVKRTFEGRFNEAPFVLDMDANLFIGPADELSRDVHSAVAVVLRYLVQTRRVTKPVRTLLKDRRALLDAFVAFDEARSAERVDEDGEPEFRIMLHGTYDGAPLDPLTDDELPAGPCGWSVNETKLHFYRKCIEMDARFTERKLSRLQAEAEGRLLKTLAATDDDVSAATATTISDEDVGLADLGDRTMLLDDHPRADEETLVDAEVTQINEDAGEQTVLLDDMPSSDDVGEETVLLEEDEKPRRRSEKPDDSGADTGDRTMVLDD